MSYYSSHRFPQKIVEAICHLTKNQILIEYYGIVAVLTKQFFHLTLVLPKVGT